MFLEISIGNEDPKTYSLKNRMLVGASAPCDIILPVKGLSRKHVLIFQDNGEYFVTDQGSTNGTYVNESRIKPGVAIKISVMEPVRLSGDVLLCLMDDQKNVSHVQAPLSYANSKEVGEATTIISLKELNNPKVRDIADKRREKLRQRISEKVVKKSFDFAKVLNILIFLLLGVAGYLAVTKK